MTQPSVRYANAFMDSSRWEEITLRPGDIVISTPAKCGTTWTQMICALLIFQRPDLPAPLDELSLWVDLLTRPRGEVRAIYESQTHRRFFKTHTPPDGLPWHDQVTYLCMGRDPRDVAISWDHHLNNSNIDLMMTMRDQVAAVDGLAPDVAEAPLPPPPPEDPAERFWAWIDDPDPGLSLAGLVAHVAGFWRLRQHPNVILLHYDDLQTDLAAQMRLLASRLDIEVPEDRWPELVEAARFTSMKRRAADVAPEHQVWHDPAAFFHSGTSGQWRELLDDAGLRRYQARVAELADPELRSWLHRRP